MITKEQKCHDSQVNRVVIHLGEQEKRVYRNELDEFLSRGWEVGTSAHHKQRLSSSHTGISPWNKGTTGVMKKNQTSFGKGHAPWNKGTKGAQVGWSKGLTKETDVRVMKYALSNKENWKTNTKRKLALIEVNKSLKGRKLTPSQKEHFLKSSYDTKLRNNTFNSSSQEEQMYKMLCTKYGTENVKRQYRDKNRYPFRCDFYIEGEDLFIELNLHWTHGGMPFENDNPECIKKLNEWKQKSVQSKYYAVAIETWTIRDVNKLKTALNNKLNYKVVYKT